MNVNSLKDISKQVLDKKIDKLISYWKPYILKNIEKNARNGKNCTTMDLWWFYNEVSYYLFPSFVNRLKLDKDFEHCEIKYIKTRKLLLDITDSEKHYDYELFIQI